jgi:hypothetical protein
VHSHIQHLVLTRDRHFRSGPNVVPPEVLSFTVRAFNNGESRQIPRQLLRIWRMHWLQEQQYQFRRQLWLRRKDWTARDRRHRRRLVAAKPVTPRPTHYKRSQQGDGLDNQYGR